MTDAATLAAQVAADEKSLAAADFATLQAFNTAAQGGTFTVASFTAALAALPASLGDPDRQRRAQIISDQFTADLSQFAALLSDTQAAGSGS